MWYDTNKNCNSSGLLAACSGSTFMLGAALQPAAAKLHPT